MNTNRKSPYKLTIVSTGEVLYLNLDIESHALLARIYGSDEAYQARFVGTRFGRATYSVDSLEIWESNEPKTQDWSTTPIPSFQKKK